MRKAFIQCLTCVCLLLVSLHAWGQSARFSGHVTDPSGAAIPNAAVQVVNQDTGVVLSAATDGKGEYSVPYLEAGRYQIVVQASGFNQSVRNIRLQAGQAAIHDVQLSVGASQTKIDVAGGGAASVETENSELSGTITQKEVTGYGLNGRIATQLIALTPGVTNQTGQDEGKTGVAGSAKYSVNGGRVQYNVFEVDGSDVLNNSINASRGGNTFVVNPSVDAIAEMKVLTSNYGAMYGRTASGIVQMTTKSGTSGFHGNLYEFVRNEMFNAKNYFDQTNGAPLYRRNDFGGTIGGPLYIPNLYNDSKKKTFFFFSEEARLEKTPVQYNQAVPSLAERAGDFSALCPATNVQGQISAMSQQAVEAYNAQNGTHLYSKTQYPDCPIARYDSGSYYQFMYPSGNFGTGVTNMVPIDPISRALLGTGLLPKPNAVAGCNSPYSSALNPSCYVATVSPSTYWREELFRLDHNLTAGQSLTFRYIHDTWNTTVLTPQWGLVQNSFPTVRNYIDGPGLSLMASLSGMVAKSFLQRLTFSYVAEHVTLTAVPGPGVTLDRSAVGGGILDSSTNGLGSFFNNGYGDKIPALLFKGANVAYGAHGFNMDTGYAPWQTVNPTYTIGDDLSRTIGKHTLQFGVQVVLAQQNEVGASNGLNSGDVQGALSFNMQGAGQSPLYGSLSSCNYCVAGGDTTNAFANFLGGQIASYQQDSAQRKYYNRYQAAEPYLQDNWRVTPRLTLNLGLRVGLFGSWYNAKGTAYNWVPRAFDPSVAAGVTLDPIYGFLLRWQGDAPNTSMYTVPLDPNNPDPAIVNGLVQCGKNGVPKSCMSSHIFNPMPRIGFAWDVFGDGKTSLRAGYGIFFEHGTSYEANTGSLIGSAPLTMSQTSLAPASYQCLGGYGKGCQGPNSTDIVTGPVAYPLNVTSIPTKATYPYTQQWSLTVEQELHKNFLASFAYVGSKGTHLTAVRDLNQVKPVDPALNPFEPGQPIGGGASGVTVSQGQPGWDNISVATFGAPGGSTVTPNLFRPHPSIGGILSVANIADSDYNAFQISVRRTVAPLVLGVAYTYSHSIDDSSDRSDANFVNSYDLSMNKASSSFDQRHNLVVSYIYDLPIMRFLGAVKDWGNADGASPVSTSSLPPSFSSLTRTLFDKWQLSGITLYQTGTPFSIVNGGSSGGISVADNAGVANYFGTGSYADCVSSANGASSVSKYAAGTFGPMLGNPSKYVAPRGLTFGNCGRNSANNPSRLNFNMALLKHFKIMNERDLEFRAEAFNVFNHTQFRIYDPTHPGNTGNNVIGCYGNAGAKYSAAGGGGVDCQTGNSFLHPVDAHDPRILQFGMKLSF